MVNYDVERGITVFTSSGGSSGVPEGEDGVPSPGKTKSQFVIAEATPADSGNYTCKPSNAVPASIQVFVSNTRGNVSSEYIHTTYVVPSPFLSCSLLSLHPFMPTCQQRGKDKSPCPCFLPTKAHLDSLFCYWPLWLADYALGILQVHTPLLL